MAGRRIASALAAMLALSLAYGTHSLLRTVEMLRVISFHETERFAGKLDAFLEQAARTEVETLVDTNSSPGPAPTSNSKINTIPDEVRKMLTASRDTAWVRADNRVWVARPKSSKGVFGVVEIPLVNFFKLNPVPKTTQIYLADIFGNPLFALNQSGKWSSRVKQDFAKMLQSPLNTGFRSTSDFSSHQFYSVLPKSEAVLLSTTSLSQVAAKVRSDLLIVMTIGLAIMACYVGFEKFSSWRPRRRKPMATSQTPQILQSPASDDPQDAGAA